MKYLILLLISSLHLLSQGRCTSSTKFTLSAGSNIVIPAISGQNIHICDVTFSLSAADSVNFYSSGTGNPTITGVMPAVQFFGYNYSGNLATGISFGFGITTISATGGGVVTWYNTPQ